MENNAAVDELSEQIALQKELTAKRDMIAMFHKDCAQVEYRLQTLNESIIKAYDKDTLDELVLEYSQAIQAKNKEIQRLTKENNSLSTRLNNAISSKVIHRRAVLDWKKAYDNLSKPLGEIERVIKAYKENIMLYQTEEEKKTIEKESDMCENIIVILEDTYGVAITPDTQLEELDICSDLRLISLVSLLETELGIPVYKSYSDNCDDSCITTVADIINLFKDEVE